MVRTRTPWSSCSHRFAKPGISGIDRGPRPKHQIDDATARAGVRQQRPELIERRGVVRPADDQLALRVLERIGHPVAGVGIEVGIRLLALLVQRRPDLLLAEQPAHGLADVVRSADTRRQNEAERDQRGEKAPDPSRKVTHVLPPSQAAGTHAATRVPCEARSGRDDISQPGG